MSPEKPKNNKFEILKFLAVTHRTLHEKRQQYEWRIIFTVLTFYVLSVAAMINKKNSLPNFAFFNVAVWFLFLCLAALSAGCLLCMHIANARNKTFAEIVEEGMLELLKGRELPSLEFPEKNYRMSNWAFVWQATTIFVMAICSATIITTNHCNDNSSHVPGRTVSSSIESPTPISPPK
ncbi:MAG: hypothetical protein KQH63_04895 [Desulfobulbaceae bacterium]|nr:hypothetical protein [Desulfobulbaceae bacterium]